MITKNGRALCRFQGAPIIKHFSLNNFVEIRESYNAETKIKKYGVDHAE